MSFFRELFSLRSLMKFGLLWLAVSMLASGLGSGIAGMNYSTFYPVALLALCMGWILAFGRTYGPAARDFIIATGLFFVFMKVGNLWPELADFLQDALSLPAAFLRSLITDTILDLMPARASANELLTRSLEFLEKIVLAIRARSLEEAKVREFAWDLAVFFSSAWAAWTLKRKQNVLLALSPMIAVLAYTLYSTNGQPLPLQILLAIFLLLTGIHEWEKRYEALREDHGRRKAVFDTFLTVTVLSVAIALIAGLVPSISWKRMANQIQESRTEARNEEVAEALGLEENPAASGDVYTPPGLPREHLVGQGTPTLSPEEVFTVQVSDPSMLAAEIGAQVVPRYYWRSVTFDIYNGRGWETTLNETLDYEANQVLYETAPQGYRLIYLDLQKRTGPDSQLYWTGTVASVDQHFQVGWRALPGSLPETVDPFAGADPLGGKVENERYQVTSLLPTPTVEELQAAGQDYPEVIRERYMALPSTVPDRVRALAVEITAGSETPYEKAKALEEYLRTYPYTLDVPPPPEEGDIADYFLFDLRKGYCDYYATSMVVMARTVGLPARMVAGYATGTYRASSDDYLVRRADAHSWVEIYFPGIGWVEFEPTASQPLLEQPTEEELGQPAEEEKETAEETPAPIETPEEKADTTTPRTSLFRTIAVIVGPLFMISVLGVGLFILLRSPSSSKATIRQIYARVFKHGNKLAPAYVVDETPLMFAERLRNRLTYTRRGRFTSQWLEPAVSELDFLTRLYVRTVYSPLGATNEEDEQARNIWRKLYWRLWLARILRGKSS